MREKAGLRPGRLVAGLVALLTALVILTDLIEASLDRSLRHRSWHSGTPKRLPHPHLN
jgi:hypothetical protein